MSRIARLALAAALLATPRLAAQELQTGAESLKIGGRVQLQMRSASCTDLPGDPSSACGSEEPAFEFFIRRARLTLDAKINDRLDLRIQGAFESLESVEVKDAWGRYTFSPGARLKVGHFKRPFDGFQLTSSSQILTIERDLDIPGVSSLTAASYDEFTTKFNLSDRDVGIQLDGSTEDERFSYWVGVFNGGTDRVNGDSNGKVQFAGRAQVALEAGDYPLTIAGAVAITDEPFTNASGELDGEYFSAFEIFAEYGNFTAGPHLQAGLVFGENPTLNEAGGDIDLLGGEDFASLLTWQAIASWKFAVESPFLEAVEPVFRVTRADPATDVDDDENWGFTPGIQFFFHKRNKLALNWDIVSFADDALDSENSFKAQLQFHF